MTGADDLAYQLGKALRHGVDQLNKAADDGQDKISKIAERVADGVTRADESTGFASYPTVSNRSNDTNNAIDTRIAGVNASNWNEEARKNGEFGPDRGVAYDFADGSTTVRPIRETQASRSAVRVMTEILSRKLIDSLSVDDDDWTLVAHETSPVEVVLFAVRGGRFREMRPLAIVHVVKTDGDLTEGGRSIAQVPYNLYSREWPWPATDSSKKIYMATDL